MAKPRRNVKFNHRNGNGSSTGLDGRRSSFSDISEGGSEHGSDKQSSSTVLGHEVREPKNLDPERLLTVFDAAGANYWSL